MSRPSKGPQLKLKRYSDGRQPMFVITDGQRTLGTGCDARHRPDAERKLAEYILSKHDPAKAIDRQNPNAAKIADVLAVEMKHVANLTMPDDRKRTLIAVLEKMGAWFGDRCVGDLNGDLQERYAAERRRFTTKKVGDKRIVIETDIPAPASAYRDLKLLSAAINRFLQKKVGGVQTKFTAVLPDAPSSRVRYLSRDEAARLIWAAWRGNKRKARHIARYILVGVYTGSRNGDICKAAMMPTLGRGYIDAERGIFRRKPEDKKGTTKLQPTIPLPSRLLAHVRRWKRLGISNKALIEYAGKPVSRIHDGWEMMVKNAGLATNDKSQKILRHTLRHTAISWYLQPDRRTGKVIDIEIVSQYCGVSVETIRKVYRHEMAGTFGPLLQASQSFGR